MLGISLSTEKHNPARSGPAQAEQAAVPQGYHVNMAQESGFEKRKN